MHPRSKHWHLLDYVLVKAVDLQDVQITRVMCGAECWTDHRLVRTSLRIRIRPPARKQKPQRRLKVSGLGRRADLSSLVYVQPYRQILHRSQIVHLCRFKAARTLQNSGTH